jgi:hypothetical protein
MYIVRRDVKNNRLYITLSGVISIADAGKIKEEMFNEIAELQPGFDIINDMSKFIRGEDAAGIILQNIISHLTDKKVRQIIRIVGPSKTGLMQFAKNSITNDIEIKYVPTLKEAEKLLSK